MTNAEWLEAVELSERDEATRVLPTGVLDRLRPIAAELRAARSALEAADRLAAAARAFSSDLELRSVLDSYRAAAEVWRKVAT